MSSIAVCSRFERLRRRAASPVAFEARSTSFSTPLPIIEVTAATVSGPRPLRAKQLVDRGRNIGRRIDQRAVKVEQDGARPTRMS